MNNQEISKEELRKKIEELLEEVKKESDVRDYYAGLETKSARRVEELLNEIKGLTEKLKSMK